MAAPTRNLFGTATTGASNSDTLTVSMTTMASGSAVGDRIVVFVASDGIQTQSISSGANWSKTTQQNEAAQACLALFEYTVTSAGTIPDLVVDMGASTEMAVAHVFRIRPTSGYSVVSLTPVGAQGSSTNPNPASISNGSGATRDIYYLAVWGGDGNNVVSTAAPTNYANHQSTGIANNNGCAIGSADRTRTGVANGGAEDPGTFTRATEQWATLTIGYYEIPAIPNITSTDTASVDENTTLSKSLTADISVSWSLVGGADQSKFELSGSTLRWLSNGTKNYESPDDADTNNQYVVTVRATGTTGGTSDQTITVTVNNVSPAGATDWASTQPSVANTVANQTHVGDTNKSYHASNFAIVGGTNSSQFALYDNAGVLAVRTNSAPPLTAGTSSLQIRDITNGPAGTEEARTDTLSITVTDPSAVSPRGFAYIVGV